MRLGDVSSIAHSSEWSWNIRSFFFSLGIPLPWPTFIWQPSVLPCQLMQSIKFSRSLFRQVLWGVFFWDYSVYSLGIAEYTEYQFPMKQIARYYENRIADMIKRDWRGRAIFPPKYYSVHSSIGGRMNGIVFRSFWNRNSSQKNTSTLYSGIGINRIVPKERAFSFHLESVAVEIGGTLGHWATVSD